VLRFHGCYAKACGKSPSQRMGNEDQFLLLDVVHSDIRD
jgi:hypothetical protein